jgi:hypothetical protein
LGHTSKAYQHLFGDDVGFMVGQKIMSVFLCMRVCRSKGQGGYTCTNTHTHTTLSSINVKMRNIMAGVFIISSVTNSQSQCSYLLQRLLQILKLSARTHVHYRNSLQNIAVADFQCVDRETTRQRTGRACAAGCRSAVYAHAHVLQMTCQPLSCHVILIS